MDFTQNLLLAFIPLFVAIDAPGVLPMFISLTNGLTETTKRRLINQATLTALVVAIAFMALGKLIFSFIGITENDFRIAGGIVLLILSIQDLLFSDVNSGRQTGGEIGIVPIGIPLIMGPGALTSIIIVTDSYGFIASLISILLNLAIVWLLFSRSQFVIKIVGEGGSKAFAKVASLFLAAIAIMMIRVGLMNILT